MTPAGRAEPARPEEDAGLQSLLEYLKHNRGFDFTGYKRSSLGRRIRKRMQEVGIRSYEEYQDHLEVAPDEFTELFDTILINVTGFYRDKAAWTYVAEDVVPQILEDVPAPEPIRVWSAACATGEEAYTLAMILAETLGEDDFRERVKIYATTWTRTRSCGRDRPHTRATPSSRFQPARPPSTSSVARTATPFGPTCGDP